MFKLQASTSQKSAQPALTFLKSAEKQLDVIDVFTGHYLAVKLGHFSSGRAGNTEKQ